MLLITLAFALAADIDGDGYDDATVDNCPGVHNPDQTDVNGDGYGDLCVDVTAVVDATATLGSGVEVGPGVRVAAGASLADNVFVGARAFVGEGASIGARTVLARRVIVSADAVIGADVTVQRAVQVGKRARIDDEVVLGYGTRVERDAHVQSGAVLGNLTTVRENGVIGASVVLARGVDIDRCASIEASAVVGPETTVGAFANVGASARVRKDATIGPASTVGPSARIGRDAGVDAGGEVGASAVVRAGATVGVCHGVPASGFLARGTEAVALASTCMVPLVDDTAGADIWTTSVYAYDGVSQTPGGGKNEDILRIGGWGDTYLSLVRFDLTDLPITAANATVELFRQPRSSGSTASFYVDRVTGSWDWTTSGTGRDRERLWWANRPSVTGFSGPHSATANSSWQSIDVTTLYNGWTTGAYVNQGIQLRPSGTSNQWIHWQSSTPCEEDGTGCSSAPASDPASRCLVPRLRITP